MKKNIIFALSALIVIIGLSVFFVQKSNKNNDKDLSTEQIETLTVSDAISEPDKTPAEPEKIGASFDVVRVEKDGSMVAAGKAPAGSELSVMDGEDTMTTLTVNDAGEWIFIPSEPLVAGIHEIWLRDTSMNARENSEVVVVNVPERQAEDDSIAVLLSSDTEDMDILQAPQDEADAPINIRSVKYANKSFVITGKSKTAGRVNLYMDNLFLGKTSVTDGEWKLKVAKDLKIGRKYIVRADKVDAKGVVVARIEVPFEVEAGLEKSKSRRVKIVKGDCLWSIAKQVYGTGFAYVTIYKANKRQIRNPNLIYPNQVFVVPSKSGK